MIVLPSGRCAMHDESRHAEVAALRAKGGRNKARVTRVQRLIPASLKPTIAALFEALDEVHRGELDPKQATAMAALAGAVARLYQAGVLEERLAALEATQADDMRRQATW